MAELIPAQVQDFLKLFQRHINAGNVPAILSLYEVSFPQFTKRFFEAEKWPHPDAVTELVGEDEVFLILYKELYYRHIHQALKPALADRVYAWENYSDLFYHLLGAKTAQLQLPAQWLWDLIDEFIYQFEGWCQFTEKRDDKTEEELAYLRENPTFWNTVTVVGYLQYLQAKSGVDGWLERGGERGLVADAPAKRAEDLAEGEEADFSGSETYRMLGYYCIVGQLRLHVLFRDYHLALKVIQPLDLSDAGLFARLPACHANLFYFMGFAYFMMRRYTDATAAWTGVLTMTSTGASVTSQDKQVSRKTDKTLGLLALSLTLCPMRIDDTVHSALTERFGDRMRKMQDGDQSSFNELMRKYSPPRISPSPPTYAGPATSTATDVLLRCFMKEVQQHEMLPSVRSYIKLYKSVEISKLAQFAEMTTEEFRRELLCLKHKSLMRQRQGGAAASGKMDSAGESDFYIDEKDVVHFTSEEAIRHHADFFLSTSARLRSVANA